MSLLPVYKDSFFVSQQRLDGMRLKMRYGRGLVYTDMSIGNAFEGYEDVVHGGMLFGVLDVIMWYVIFLETGKICMTRKTDMDFLKPVMCDTRYRAGEAPPDRGPGRVGNGLDRGRPKGAVRPGERPFPGGEVHRLRAVHRELRFCRGLRLHEAAIHVGGAEV